MEVLKNIRGEVISEGQSRLTRNPKTNRTHDIKPKPKLREAFKAYTKKGITLNEAKEIAGYSDKTVSRDMTASKGWQVLLEEYLSDKELTKTHNKLLDSKNENIQIKAVDLGYKVKNKYSNEPNTATKTLNITNIMNIIQSD